MAKGNSIHHLFLVNDHTVLSMYKRGADRVVSVISQIRAEITSNLQLLP